MELRGRQIVGAIGGTFGIHGIGAHDSGVGCEAGDQLGEIVTFTVSAPSTTTTVALAKLEPPYQVSG